MGQGDPERYCPILIPDAKASAALERSPADEQRLEELRPGVLVRQHRI